MHTPQSGRILITLFLFTIIFTGCTPKPNPRYVWPAPPETPRLEFIGNFYSEGSFKKSAGGEVLEKITGGTNENRFKTPFGIASDGEGIVYISDIHSRNVFIYDFNTKTVQALSAQEMFGTPAGMTLDQNNNLYIADPKMQSVFVFSADRQPLRVIKNTEHLTQPAYVAISPDGDRLYVSDGGEHRIVVFDLNGNYLYSFGKGGDKEGEFFAPQGLTFGLDKNLYVADMLNARVQVLTPDGTFIRMFGERGVAASQMENPKDLAFDSEGNLYVIDGRRSDLTTFDINGNLLLTTGGSKPSISPFGFSTPRSVFVDKNDQILVTEALGKRFTIWQFMSKQWLQEHPYTEADRKILLEDIREKR